MLDQNVNNKSVVIRGRFWLFTMLAALLSMSATAFGATVTVTTPEGAGIGIGYRWLVEEDRTYLAKPGTALEDTQATNLYRSYMPVVCNGRSADDAPATLCALDPAKHYLVSVLPDQPAGADCQTGGCYTMSGRHMLGTDGNVTVVVTPQPLPTAQVYLRAFEDNAPINNVWDTGEQGVGGFSVFIYDFTGGQLSTDFYGNPLGTVYEDNVDGDGAPVIKRLGDGSIHTLTQDEVGDPIRNPYGLDVGDALIKNLAPGKYGVRVVPPYADPYSTNDVWQQTSTIEGTPGLDVWVKAGEPRYFAEFGAAGHHAEFGFIRPANFPALAGNGTITGSINNMRMTRPPVINWTAGHPLPSCWIGLNDSTGTQGLYAAPCAEDSSFTIENVPAGTYQLVVWDTYLLNIFNIQTVTVADGGTTDMGPVKTFRWFQTQEHYVFMDDGCASNGGTGGIAGNGQREACEDPIPEQAINLRYRDGSIYAASATDLSGYLPMEEVFPFFSWLVAEVDYARFKPTGLTVANDNGGPVKGVQGDFENQVADLQARIGDGLMNPQAQNPLDGGSNCVVDPVYDADGNITNTPEGPCWTRTETGPALTEGYNAFISTQTRFEWGKVPYTEEENGGISGIVFYATTRAENDPRYAAAEPWEPGVPRVQVNLYKAADRNGTIVDVNGSGAVELADVDNYPLGWEDGSAAMGPEDVDRNSNGVFDMGDAIEVGHTDSFDDNPPTDCPADTDHGIDPKFHLPPNGDPANQFNGRCYDGLRNYAQIRPAVFDGGYGLGAPFSDQVLESGFYVVEAKTPPGYETLVEESKNVDFGDTFTINPLALPPVCVGDARVVGDELSLFPGIEAPFATQTRPTCDRKLVQVSAKKNAAADFFVYTEVPVGGHIQGFVLNDLANEFDPNSPNFGEKFAPSFIPVSVRDYAGNEVYHTTTDEWGTYNAVVPSSYRINAPFASGVSANMLQVCLNSPFRVDPATGLTVKEEHFNPQYTQFCYTLNFQAGLTTFLDTPVLPISAFANPGNFAVDCDYPTGTPVIAYANVSSTSGFNGPYVSPNDGTRRIEITSLGTVDVRDPNAPRLDGANASVIQRDYGFGATAGTVTINGVALTNVTWNDVGIQATIPPSVGTGQLVITRGDTGRSTVDGLTVIIGVPELNVHQVAQTSEPSTAGLIQAEIDRAKAGDVVLVPQGSYLESLIITKPIQLQGSGRNTVLNATQSPTSKIGEWRKKVNRLANCTGELGLLPNQTNNILSTAVVAECGYMPGSGLFTNDEGAGILVAPRAGAFNGTRAARIDGFTITGADQSGGIVVNGYADFLEISNNLVVNNQSTAGAAGIRIGPPSLLDADENWTDGDNDSVNIHNNHVTNNGSLFEPGAGIGLYTGSDNYKVTSNQVCGNFSQADGGGIAHYGLSQNGLIADNKVLFNQSFDQTAGVGGSGAGILVGGHEPLTGGAITVSAGSGDVQVVRNQVQGNNAGSGDGGGIAIIRANGLDVEASGQSNNWHLVDVTNNMVINNVAGMTAGGIVLKDSVRVRLSNNTVMNNDSTATVALAFAGCDGATYPNLSCPQPAGIVSYAHSPEFAATRSVNSIRTFSNPAMVNNIVLGNRSQHWEQGPTPNGGVSGALHADGYSDFAVFGTAGTLTTAYSVIAEGASVTNGGGNVVVAAVDVDAQTCLADSTSSTLVQSCYRNGPPGFATINADGTYQPGGEPPTIPAFAAADEGGNFIDVHYGPLSPVNDYHLKAGSPAINAGATPPGNNRLDIDRQARPQGATAATAMFDIGADEVPGAVTGNGGNQAPVIVTPPDNANTNDYPAYTGIPFSLQVIAVDPNGDALSYELCRTNSSNSTTTCAPNVGLPAGLTINPSTGLISWPNPTGGNVQTLRVTVRDGHGGVDMNRFRIVRRNANAPVTVNDTFAANSAGQVLVAAPGVLGNDNLRNQADFGVVTARIATAMDAAQGSVSLAADGSLVYTPAPSFIGNATFTYIASNNAGDSSSATVTLVRDIGVTDARYISGVGYYISGVGVPGANLTIWIDRPGGGFDGQRHVLANVTVAPDGTWVLNLAASGLAARDQDPPVGTVFDVVWSRPGPDPQIDNMVLYSYSQNSAPESTSFVQCPLDTNKNGQLDAGEGNIDPATRNWVDSARPGIVCRHLGAGDGFARMADDANTELYGFGFNDLTGQASNLAIDKGLLNAKFPAPTLEFNEGEQVFLTLTNVGMLMRPDLFDPHSVHFHGFPNASSGFDGVPEASISVNPGFSLTYYYNVVEPGTYMYHCHVEAAEHMQMGMLGNLYVNPKQNGTDHGGFTRFAYNDTDGTTGYDVVVPIQIGGFDSNFHKEHIAVQPLPFAEMHDDYPLLNGRGYPDTVLAGALPVTPGGDKEGAGVTSSNETSQEMNSIVQANVGDRILLRISNLNVTEFNTLATTGLTMQVVGQGAHILRGPEAGAQGKDLYYETNSITLGGGEAVDVLIDTTGVAAGTYFLYSTNLQELSNGTEDFGGMMTEIVINP
jgi:parallel beta-helix repeat protein